MPEPSEDRVDELIGSLSLEEKVAQLFGTWLLPQLDKSDEQYLDELAARHPHGFGALATMLEMSSLDPGATARRIALAQRYLRERTRPAIPALVHAEALSGLVYGTALHFPTAIGLAATWKPESVRAMAATSARQMRALGMHHGLSPVLDVARDARFGRVHETYGEDPALCAAMGVAFVRGMQDLPSGVLATGKHFIGYMHSEGALNKASTHLGERELMEVYALPFEAAIREAGLATVMNSYCAVDGVPVAASHELLTEMLRDRLGFDGMVVSDYGAIAELHTVHRVAGDPTDAGVQALTAGLDVELPTGDTFSGLVDAVRRGQIAEDVVDTAVRRMLRAKAVVGLLDTDREDSPNWSEFAATSEEVELAAQLARDSVVLLKNAGDLLPLRAEHAKVAVIGPFADSRRSMFAGYSAPAGAEMLRGYGIGLTTTMAGVDAGLAATATTGANPALQQSVLSELDIRARFPEMVTLAAALKSAASPSTEFDVVRGVDHLDPDSSGIDEAVAAAQWADVAICVIGEKTGSTGDPTAGEGRDRASLHLSGLQHALVEAVAGTGTPVVVVLLLGRPLELTWIADNVDAMVCAFHPGQSGPQAIAEVLWGATNPGGKLPFSLPRGIGQVPVYASHRAGSGYASEPGVPTAGYVDAEVGPLFAFGHGLSYTTFELTDLRLDAPAVPADSGTLVASCLVTNTGSVAGDEVVQLYLRDLLASVTRPVRQLGGFLRVSLEPGESRRVSFSVDSAQLVVFGRDRRWRIEPGTVEVTLTTGSALPGLAGLVEITGAPVELAHRTAFYATATES